MSSISKRLATSRLTVRSGWALVIGWGASTFKFLDGRFGSADASMGSREGQGRPGPPVLPSGAAVRIEPAAFVRGTFTLPGDKSISHRAALIGAMAEGETRIRNFSSAADCASTLACLRGLGVAIRQEGPALVIKGGLDTWHAPAAVLDAGNSGSTIRMLAGALAGRPFRTTLTGDASLRRRPLERVAAPLRAMGATVETTDGRPRSRSRAARCGASRTSSLSRAHR